VKYEYGPPGAPENGVGRIVRVVDDAGAETRGYGKLGETIRSTRTVKPLKPNDSPQTFETRFEFDSFGRMLRLWYPDGEELTYTYDAGGLVNHAEGHRPATKHWDEATEVYLTTLGYDEFGARRHAVLGNTATTTWKYEADTQRLKHVDTASQGRTLQALTYTYDLVGNVKTLTNALGEPTGRRSGAVSYTYDYDDLYRLTTAAGTALSRPGVVDRFKTTYAFDEIHNMTRLDQKHWLTTANDPDNETAHPPHTNHVFDYAYGSAGPHQATKIGDRNLVYDANGNTLRECRDHGDSSCEANSDKLRRYFWGEENELNAVIDGGGWNVTRFIYDAGGQRVAKLGRGGESITIGQFFALKGRKAATKHVFVGETRVASKLLPSPGWEPSWSEGTTVSGPVVDVTDPTSGCDPSSYAPQKCPIDPAANPVMDKRPDTTKIKPATYYYHSDHLGSTSWVTDQNGRVHEHVEYFPYGEVWRDARYDSDGDPVHRQQFLFSSKEMDEETGLYYFGARYLDPVRARWSNPDPILAKLLPAGGRDGGLSGASTTNDRLIPDLPGMGGVYNPPNLGLYSYSHSNPLKLQDRDGNSPMLVGAVVGFVGGGLVGGGLSIASDLWNDREVDWGQAGRSALKGAIGGAIAGATFGLVAPAAGSLAMQAVNAGASRLVANAAGAAVGAGSSALGDAVAQGSAMALGWQDEFSWGELGVSTAVGAGFGAVGREFRVAGVRIAPFGNRAGNPKGTLPHYHRGIPNPKKPGQSLPDQGMSRHRPWDAKPKDKSFWDRF
jgi:RHS repeat-associated protein